MESINNIIFESIGHIQDQKKKRADMPTYIKLKEIRADIYKIEGNKTINESTITDTYLTNTDVLENKRSNNKDSYYLKDKKRPRDTLWVWS